MMTLLLFIIQAAHWTSFVNPQPIYDMLFQGDNIWGATNGGVLIFNKTNTSFQCITNTDGIPTNQVVKAATDKYGNIWLLCAGNSDIGGVVVMSPDMSKKKIFTSDTADLQSYNFSAIAINGDSVLVATEDSKLWLYNMNGDPFNSTQPAILKNIQPSNEIRDIKIFNDSLWFCTNKGIGKTSKSLDSFIIYNKSNGLPNDTVCTVEIWNNYIWVALKKGIARLHKDSTKWEKIDTIFIFNGVKIDTIPILNGKDFCATDTALWVATTQGTYKCTLNNDSCVWAKIANCDSRALLFDNKLWIGSAWNGIVKYDDTLHEYLKQGSATNYLGRTAVDLNGDVWATHWGGEPSWNQNKASRLHKDSNEWKWKLYEFPVPITSNVLVDKDNNKWITMADWNSNVGVAKILPNDSTIYIKIDAPGLSNMITASCLNRNGDLWIQSYDTYVRRINKKTNQVDIEFSNADYAKWDFVMAADDEENLWLGSKEPSKCIAIFDKYGSFNKTILSGEDIMFVNMEKQPSVWVGTTGGIYEVKNMQPGTPLYIPSELGGIPTDMAVDSLGIWFSIKGGGVKHLINNGGFDKSYTIQNGLVNDSALGVEVDSKNQVLWIGTSNGLSRCVITPDTLIPIKTFKVIVYPNPFVTSKGHKEILFQLDTTKFNGGKVDIYTLSGKTLATLTNNDTWQPILSWDTKDQTTGKLVPSGVYLFTAYPKNKQKQIGKFAIIR